MIAFFDHFVKLNFDIVYLINNNEDLHYAPIRSLIRYDFLSILIESGRWMGFVYSGSNGDNK